MSERPSRLPFSLSLRVGADAGVALEQLRLAVQGEPRIEVDPRPARDRRVVGVIEGPEVLLEVRDRRRSTARVGWHIELRGALVPGPTGSVLNGVVRIVYHGQREHIPWLGMIVGLLVVALAAIKTALDGSIETGLLVPGAGLGAAMILASGYLRIEVERAARDDARLLVEVLGRVLEVVSAGSAAQ